MREMIQDTIERILGDRVTPKVLAVSWQDGIWHDTLWSLLDEQGFTHALCSAETGGAGATWGDLYPLFVACGAYQLPLPLPETILANWLLEQADITHPGGLVGIVDDTGLGDRSDAAGHTSWGRRCGHFLVPRGDELLMFAANDITLTHGRNLAREPRDLVRLGAAKPIAVGGLARARANVLCHGAVMRAAQAAGASQSALRQTIRYAGERSQFGRPLAKFQAVQQQIASAVSEVAALNAASEYACSTDESGREWGAAVAKITASEAGAVVCDVAHAVHGAIGYTCEYALHHATQRLRAWSMEFGNHHWWSKRLGRAICHRGAEGLIPMIVDGTATIPGISP